MMVSELLAGGTSPYGTLLFAVAVSAAMARLANPCMRPSRSPAADRIAFSLRVALQKIRVLGRRNSGN